MHFWIICLNGVCNVLQSNGLTSLRWRHNQAALTLTNWRNNINNATHHIHRRCFHLQTLLWIQRSELGELRTLSSLFQAQTVNSFHRLQWNELLALIATVAITICLNKAAHSVTLAQTVLFHLTHRYIHIVWTWQVTRGTHKSIRIENVYDTSNANEFFFWLLLFVNLLFFVIFCTVLTIITVIIATIIALETLVIVVLV